MNPRNIARLLGTLLLGTMLGAGGWYLWKLRRHAQATAHRLQETQQSLKHTQETLALTEEERSELLLAYDELKGRLAKADEELTQLKHTSTQTTVQLSTLTSDRNTLMKQLDEAEQQTGHLDEQIKTLEAEYAAVEAEKISLEQQLQEAASASLSPAEVQQLTQAAARSQGEAARLREQMVALSRAYEQIVQAPKPQPPAPSDVHRSALRYRQLGDAYLAAYQYPKAAEAYEQALTVKDDPDTHTRLAFLYSRLLHDPRKAQRHTAAASDRDPTSTTLGVTAGAQGLPRKNWRLIWHWLTK
jgi:tetratricopeptide (TPR) repeat protein